jgi:lipoprotein-anchoring transpeptidase ErfK/SrfK
MALHTAPKPPEPDSSRRNPLIWVGVVVVAVLVAGIAFFALGGFGGTAPAPPPAAGPPVATDDLPESNTHTTIDGAPLDPQPNAPTEGVVVHPIRTTPVHDAPGGRPIARLETEQFDSSDGGPGSPTWLPMIGQQGEWLQVLLPSKPNGSTGWIRDADTEHATTTSVVSVHLNSMKMEIRDGDKVVGTWTVGTGKESAPTPAGRTFILAQIEDDQQKYSPLILPLGAHSPTLDSFGGGPGTVALHTWPTADVFGQRSSDGCIRVPKDALDKLSELPLGTLVMIDEM